LGIYAEKDSAGYYAAEANSLLWAEADGAPQRLTNPAFLQAAILHAQDAMELLPLFEAPSESSEVLDWCFVGATAIVLHVADEWAHVEVDQTEGYMPLSTLHFIDNGDMVEKIMAVRFDYRDKACLLYTAPSLDAPTVEGSNWRRYDVVQRVGTWFLVDAEGEAYYVPVETERLILYAMNVAYPDQLYVLSAREEGSRALLYAEADADSECLGVYYNGTQVILLPFPEDEDVYLSRVVIEGTEGYLDLDYDELKRVWDVWFYEGY